MANRQVKKGKKISLDYSSSIPVYLQIAETIKRRILSGQYNPGKQIFTSEELEREFQTSNITIRNAMEKLKNDGLVERRRGLGTTVSKKKPEPLFFDLADGFKNGKDAVMNFNTKVKVLEITKVISTEHMQNLLSLSTEQEIWRVKRIRVYKNLPVSFRTYYANPDYCAEISVNEAEKHDILGEIEKTNGIKIHKVIKTGRMSVADLDISSVLKIPFGFPVFFSESIYYAVSGEALMFDQIYFRGDMFVFKSVRCF